MDSWQVVVCVVSGLILWPWFVYMTAAAWAAGSCHGEWRFVAMVRKTCDTDDKGDDSAR